MLNHAFTITELGPTCQVRVGLQSTKTNFNENRLKNTETNVTELPLQCFITKRSNAL